MSTHARYNEWGRATWELQLANLKNQDGDGLQWHFCSYLAQEDGNLDDQAKLMHGQCYRVGALHSKVWHVSV